MDERQELAREFASRSGWGTADMMALAGDASARRYFRLDNGAGGRAVLMDAPPAAGQSVKPFLDVATYLHGLSLSAPVIEAYDEARGFVLMEDLGDALFAKVLRDDPGREQQLYQATIDVLVALDHAPLPEMVPAFSVHEMCQQVAPVYEWYRKAVLGEVGQDQLLQFQGALEPVLYDLTAGQQSVLLRDFHAENLIWLPRRRGIARVGILDFQDAMTGPPGYDLVSLLQDARRDVAPDLAQQMIGQFIQKSGREAQAFTAGYAIIGLQRNLRILGVFARLCMAHGKTRYVDYIPRVWGHVQNCLDHPALAGLRDMVHHDLPPPVAANLQKIRDQCATFPIQ